MPTKYPNRKLIERLYQKYLAHSIDSLDRSEVIDLINHLREALKEAEAKNKLYVVTKQGGLDLTLFLIDRSKFKHRWWSINVDEAMVFHKKSAAEFFAEKLRYGKIDVLELEHTSQISRDQEPDIESEESPFSGEAIGQW